MSLQERVYSVLVVSAAENFNASLKPLLPESRFSPVRFEGSVNVAKRLMLERGIHQDVIDTIALCGIDLDHWLEGFHDTEDSVRNTINTISHHPLVPRDVNLHGYIIDSVTGKLTEVK